MAATLFDSACDELERTTGLDHLAVRGTVRLALKSAGLDPKTMTKAEFKLVAQQILPDELLKRGIADAPRLCAVAVDCLGAGANDVAAPDSPDEIFRRLAAR